MDHKENAFREIGIALAKHFVSLFFIDIETGLSGEKICFIKGVERVKDL